MQKTRVGKMLRKFNNLKRAKVAGTSKGRRRMVKNEGVNISRILLNF